MLRVRVIEPPGRDGCCILDEDQRVNLIAALVGKEVVTKVVGESLLGI